MPTSGSPRSTINCMARLIGIRAMPAFRSIHPYEFKRSSSLVRSFCKAIEAWTSRRGGGNAPAVAAACGGASCAASLAERKRMRPQMAPQISALLRNNAIATPKRETTSASRRSCPAFMSKAQLQIADHSAEPAVWSLTASGRRQTKFHRCPAAPQARPMKRKNLFGRKTAPPSTKHRQCA